MIAEDLDYRHLADPERYPIDIGTNAIGNLNARRFPTTPDGPTDEELARMGVERRTVYAAIASAGERGIVGTTLLAELAQQARLVDYQVRTQVRYLLRDGLIVAEPEPGTRGHAKRYRVN